VRLDSATDRIGGQAEPCVRGIHPEENPLTVPSLRAPLPIDESDARNQSWLERLQGGILRGHGRDFASYLFFEFGNCDANRCAKTVRELTETYVTSAARQYRDTVIYRKTGLPGPTFGSIFLTAHGYEKLGLSEQAPNEAVDEPDRLHPTRGFCDGMKGAVEDLNDPPVSEWDEGYRHRIDAMLLLADDDERHLSRVTREAYDWLSSDHVVHVCERGAALRNEKGEGIEHFGYVDGRSQPLFLADDFTWDAAARLTGERGRGAVASWNPFAPLDLVLVPDALGGSVECFGSFLVFRKLEQNVRGFIKREAELADALGLQGADRERAGASVVGRFRDGTPVVLSDRQGWRPREDNNFTYEEDARGRRCPLQAHIRKVNPRTKIEGFAPALMESPEDRRIARRSITYGKTTPASDDSVDMQPTKGVGLLFMCFQASIRRQFAFMQRVWANNPFFPSSIAGTDPLIGQSNQDHRQYWRPVYNDLDEIACDFQKFVTMKGGEYFFAPSLPFLTSVGLKKPKSHKRARDKRPAVPRP
jgi:Dyp-type peroxidase family